MAPTFYFLLLFLIALFAIVRGGVEHRLAIGGCVVATFATNFVMKPISMRFTGIEYGVLVIDLTLFALFLWLALRSNRFWPLWIAGFHLTSLISHALKALRLDIMPAAYQVASQFWSYPILLIIGIAIWRAERRRLAGEAGEFPAGPPAAAA